MADEDFDLEPYTPATLDNVGQQDTQPPGEVGSHGNFPAPTRPLDGNSAAVPAPTSSGAVAVGAEPHKTPLSSSPPGTRYRNNPYATSPRVSPSIPVGGTPPNLSPHQTPVGSLDHRGSAPPVGSKGRYDGGAGVGYVPTGPSPNARYKAEMCKHIVAQTGCPRGATCNFAHSAEELRTNATASGTPTASSAPRSLPGGIGARPRLSGASVDDGGRMGQAMSQEPPRPSWMGGGASGSAAAGTSAPSASQPIPVSPIAEAMLRPQSGSIPRGSAPGAGSLGTSAPRGSAPGSSAPRFSGSARR